MTITFYNPTKKGHISISADQCTKTKYTRILSDEPVTRYVLRASYEGMTYTKFLTKDQYDGCPAKEVL